MWRAGGTFQEWSEHFDLDLWDDAMAAEGLDPDWYVYRHRTEDEVLPWDHLSAGLHKDFLWQDWRDALAEAGLEDCRWTPCYDCGACTGYGIEHVVASAVPPAGGSQGTGPGPRASAARGAGASLPARAEAAPMRGDSGFPVRIRFAKLGKIRFTSHRDVARMWERAFRRAELPVAYTEGFSPRPKVSFGLALSTGHESLAEYLDVELTEPVDTEALPERLTPALPEGMAATGAVRLIERAPALQEAVTEVQCRGATVDGRGQAVPADVLAAAAAGALASDELAVTRTRKGKESVDDLRPAIRAIEVGHDGDGPVLDRTLPTQPRGARPREVLDALDRFTDRWRRRPHRGPRAAEPHQWIERDGARREPLGRRRVRARPGGERS